MLMIQRVTNQVLIHDVKQITKENGGYAPHPGDFKRSGTAVRRFGSWREFIKTAKIPATYLDDQTYYTIEEIDCRMNEIIKSGETNFTWEHLIHFYKLPMQLIMSYFGSLQIFLTHYGISKYQHYKKIITMDDIHQNYEVLCQKKDNPTEQELTRMLGFSDTRKISSILKQNGYSSFWDFKLRLQKKNLVSGKQEEI